MSSPASSHAVDSTPPPPDKAADEARRRFADSVARHSPMVAGVCRRMLEGADVEDAAQAVFLLFWQKGPHGADDSTIAGWLHRTARNVCHNARRSRQSRHRHERSLEGAATRNDSMMNERTTQAAEWSEVKSILDDEIDRLPEPQRRSFVLFHLEHRSLQEIASLLGAGVSTVGSRLQRARERLALRLRRRGVDIGAAGLAALLADNLSAETVSASFVAATVANAVGPAETSASLAIRTLVRAELRRQSVAFWRRLATLLAVASCLGLTTVEWLLPMAQTRLSPDFAALQGEWQAVASEQQGGPVDAQPAVAFVETFVVEGRSFRRFQTLSDGRVLSGDEGSFVLDSQASPPAIDFHLWQGSIRGVYRLEGDQLTLCVVRDDGARPADFTTRAGDSRILSRYRRASHFEPQKGRSP